MAWPFDQIGAFFTAAGHAVDSFVLNNIVKPVGDAMDYIVNAIYPIRQIQNNLDAAQVAAANAQTAKDKLLATYRAQAEIGAMRTNESARSNAIQAFQQGSAAEAGAGASGLEGGTPFWAVKNQMDEAHRSLGASFDIGMKELDLMRLDTSYGNKINLNNIRIANDNLSSAQTAMVEAPLGFLISGAKTLVTIAMLGQEAGLLPSFTSTIPGFGAPTAGLTHGDQVAAKAMAPASANQAAGNFIKTGGMGVSARMAPYRSIYATPSGPSLQKNTKTGANNLLRGSASANSALNSSGGIW